MEIVESTPAAKTRHRVASRPRADSASSVESLEATLIHLPILQQSQHTGVPGLRSTAVVSSFGLLTGLGPSTARSGDDKLLIEANPRSKTSRFPSLTLQSLPSFNRWISWRRCLPRSLIQAAPQSIRCQTSSKRNRSRSSDNWVKTALFSSITDRFNHLEQNLEARPGPANRIDTWVLVLLRISRPRPTMRSNPHAFVNIRHRERTP